VDGAAQERRRFAWLGPVAVIAVLVALVVAACPGWLQGTYEPRGWHVHVDPSLKRVAEQLADWHGIGRLGADARGYSPSVDLAHYIEWFCPEEKVFRDSRTNLYPASVESDHQKVARALTAESGLRFDETWADAHDALNRYGVTHLVVADAADRRLVAALRNLLNMPREWRLVGLYGRTAVFARTPARQPGPDLPLMSLDRRVFGGAAPRQGPGRDLQPRPWWDCFVWSDPDGGLDRDEAIVEVMHFDAMGPAYRERNRRTWEVEVLIAQLGTIAPQGSLVEALAGCYPHSLLATSQRPIPAGVPTALDSLTYQMIAAHAQNSDQGPPGSLLFAVRAARRALLANPEDALAHLALGRAYERFQRFSAERGAGASFPLLKQVREVQALVALNRAVQLKPDLLAAHELLASLYLEARGFDLALPHVQAQLRLTQSAGPRPGEKPQDFTARIDKLTAQEHTLGKQVRELLNLVDSQSLKLDAYGKARLAEANGLPGYALQHLLRSNYAEFGVEGALNQLHLLLRTGRTKDIRMMIDPAQEAKMGMFNYRWLRTLLAVADGDYDQADAHLQQLVVGGVDLPDLGARNLRPHTALAMLVGQQMLNGGSIHPQQPIVQVFTLGPWQDVDTQAIYVRKLEGLAGIARMDADVHALRGLLHLESGAIEPARRAFRDALTDWNSDGGSAFLAKHYLNLIP
jgi:tetratricopeptide (TPR) repeat protein